MNSVIRILAGTTPPGGATCLFPVVRELCRREGVEVHLLSHGHSAEVFTQHGLSHHALQRIDTEDALDAAFVARSRPDLILTGVFPENDGVLDRALLRAARDTGIPTMGVLDAWMNYAARFVDLRTGDPTGGLPDVVAVMDCDTADELAAVGIPRDRLAVTGHPFLSEVRRIAGESKHRDRTRQRLELRPDERLVVFFSEPIRWGVQQGRTDPVGYDEFDAYDVLQAALRRSQQAGCLIVKEHPKGASLSLPQRIGRTRVTPCPDAAPLVLIEAADVVVGMSSTLLVYACLLGRQVVVIQPGLRRERDCNVLTRRGVLANARTEEHVSCMLKEPEPSLTASVEALRNAVGWNDRPEVRVAELGLSMSRADGLPKHLPAVVGSGQGGL